MLTATQLAEFFSKTFLFKNIDLKTIEDILQRLNLNYTEFQKKETICSFDSEERRVGFILTGECIINRITAETVIPINRLQAYSSFGIASTFSEQHKYLTQIVALRPSKIVFIERRDIISLLKLSPEISLNIIEFLSDRIGFLNDKISTFSINDCALKVARFIVLKNEAEKSNCIKFSCKTAAETLNIGRASIYRALKILTDLEYIEHESKKIIIKNINGLKGILK